MDSDKGAIISECGAFRYRLWRRWSSNVKPVAFIMLNPSTADASEDDPTIRKCIGFATRIGQGAVEVVNLFAFRATKPADLKAGGFRRGPDNYRHIIEACEGAALTICGWGAHARGLSQPAMVLDILKQHGIETHALAFTEDGIPRHPLMLPYSCSPQPMSRSGKGVCNG